MEWQKENPHLKKKTQFRKKTISIKSFKTTMQQKKRETNSKFLQNK
jgi:hypothetical protein